MDLSHEQDFPKSNLITTDHMGEKTGFLLENVHLCGKTTLPEQSSMDF
jgi:hypothetical protein